MNYEKFLSEIRFNKIANGIYEIENFITDDLLNKIVDHIDAANQNDWIREEDYFGDLWKDKSLDYSDSLFNEINSLLEFTFIDKEYLPPMKYIHRYSVGDHIKQHRDHWIEDDHVEYGALLYLNDEYTGGYLVYPESNIKIKPKPKSLIIHHGNILHESTPVESGLRYFSSTFIKGTSQNKVTLNEKIGVLDYV